VVRCKGQWLSLGVIVDPLQGLVLSIDQLEGEDAQTLQQWIAPIADQVGAQVLVSDDADAFKHAADDSGLDQQVCKSHVVRNTEALISSLSAALQNHPDDSLSHLNLSPEQALADLKRLGISSILASLKSRPRYRPCMSVMPPPPPLNRASPPRWLTACGISSWIAGTCGRG
jgi:hypothetical protein